MANYCILRTRKLKTPGNVGASIRHAFRTRETPNADQERTPQNMHKGAQTCEQAMGQFKKLLPEKVRSNGVRCIEYLVTASPEALEKMTKKQQLAYFSEALGWLQEKHGKNLFYAGIHTDEKTIHMYAYAVPIDERGKLNCRAFLGGRDKLRAMQDSFAESVGKKFGLMRGIRGSRARHQTVKSYYGKLAQIEEAIKPPKRKMGEHEDAYAERYKAQIRPLLKNACAADALKKQVEQFAGHYETIKKGFYETNNFLEGLSEKQKKEVAALVREYQTENQNGKNKTRGQGLGKSH